MADAEHAYKIQYGTDQARRFVRFGIEPPLEPHCAKEVFEHISQHIGAYSLAARCELASEEILPGSLPHTLITLHEFEGQLNTVIQAIEAKLAAMSIQAIVENRHYVLRTDLGLNLFFVGNKGK